VGFLTATRGGMLVVGGDGGVHEVSAVASVRACVVALYTMDQAPVP